MHVRTRRLALIEGITAGFLFSTAAIFIRVLGDLGPIHVAFWRVVIACFALGFILVCIGKSVNLHMARENLKELLILSFFLALHFIFFVSAVNETTILNATVLVNTAPIFSMFISSLFFHISPSRLAVLGLTVSFIGVIVIAYAETTIPDAQTNQSIERISPSLRGDLKAVLAALIESFYLNYGIKIRKKMKVLPTMFPIYSLTAAIIGVIGIPTTNLVLSLPIRMEVIFPLIGLGVLPTAIAHTLYFSSLSNLKSFETATMALLEPIGATFLGIILLKERPAPLFIFGAAMILAGVLFIVKEKK
jgi:drug/metabolite transporter (DMT)-like permease